MKLAWQILLDAKSAKHILRFHGYKPAEIAQMPTTGGMVILPSILQPHRYVPSEPKPQELAWSLATHHASHAANLMGRRGIYHMPVVDVIRADSEV